MSLFCTNRRKTKTVSGSHGATCHSPWFPFWLYHLANTPLLQPRGAPSTQHPLLAGRKMFVTLQNDVMSNLKQAWVMNYWEHGHMSAYCLGRYIATFPAAFRPPQKPAGRPPTPKLLKSPGTEDPGNLRPIRVTPERPVSPTPIKAQEEEEQVLSPPQPRPQPLGQNKTSAEQTPAAPSGQSTSFSTTS